MANIYELPLPDGTIVEVEGDRPPTREEWMRAIGPKFAPSTSGGLPMIAEEGLLAKARRASGGTPQAQAAQPFLGETELGRQLEYSGFERQKVENQRAQAARALNQQIENTIGTAGLRIGAPVAATLALVTPGAQPTIPALLSIGASGLLGEQAAQVAEGRNPLEAGNIPEQVAAGLLAPIGVGATSARGLSAIRQGLTEGLTIAGGNEAARSIGASIRGEEYRPDLSTVINFGLGAGLGTLGRAAEARAPAPPPKIEPAPATAAGDAAQAASQIKQQGGANAQATLTQLSMGQADAGLREVVPTEGVRTPFDEFATRAANTSPEAKERILQQLVDDVSLAEAQRDAARIGIPVDSKITEAARRRVLKVRQGAKDVDEAIERLTTRLEESTPTPVEEIRPTTQERRATPTTQTEQFNKRQKGAYTALTDKGVPAKEAREAARALAGTTDPQEYQLIYQGALERFGKVEEIAPRARATTRQLRNLEELTPEAVGLPPSNALPEPTPAVRPLEIEQPQVRLQEAPQVQAETPITPASRALQEPIPEAPVLRPESAGQSQDVELQRVVPQESTQATQAQAPRVDRRQLLRQRAAERGMVKPKPVSVEPSSSLPARQSLPASETPVISESAPETYGTRYVSQYGREAAIQRIAHLESLNKTERYARAMERRFDEINNIQKALDALTPPLPSNSTGGRSSRNAGLDETPRVRPVEAAPASSPETPISQASENVAAAQTVEGLGFIPPYKPREGGGYSAIILADGTAIVGGKNHPQTISQGEARGLITNENLSSAIAGLVRPDGFAFDISSGRPVRIRRIEWLDKPINTQQATPQAAQQVTGQESGLAATPQVRPLSMRERERLGFLDRKFARTALSEAEETERRTLRGRARAMGEAGFASGPVVSGLSGSAAGGVGGYLSTERQEGETEEEFRARRLFNTISAGIGGGAVTAAGAEVLGRIKMPKPNRANPNLPNELLDVVNRTEQAKPLGEKLESLYLDARYNLDSKSSAIRYVQRKLADNVGKSVTFGGVNDLGAAYESLPAAVARAGRWIRAMNDVVSPVPKEARPWMETLVAGRRILSRLESNERNNIRLLDDLQQAQIDLDAARQANANYDKFILDERSARTEFSNARKALSKDPTPDNWQNYWQAEFEYNQARQARIDNAAVARGLESAKDRVTAANNAIKEGFDRKKTGKFGLPGEAGKVDIADEIRKTEQAIVNQFGPDVLKTINDQIDLYQGIMRGGLQETVRAGLLSPDAYRRIIADNDFYAPFAVLREIDEEVKRAGPAGKIGGVASSAAVTRAIKGIKDPDFKLDNIFAVSAEQLFNNSIRSENNRFMRRFATLARQDPSGDYIRRIAADEKPRPGYEVITYMDSGTPRRLEVIPEISRVLGSVEAQNADLVADAIRTGGNVFKLFVTGVNPFFQIPNYLFYDSTRANIFSRYGLGQGPQRYALAPIYMLTDALPALFSSARANLLGQQDELYKRAIDTGVLSGVFSRYLRPQAFQRTLPSNRTAVQVLRDNRFGVDPIMNYWGRIGAVLEEATKIEGTKRAARWHMVDVPASSIGVSSAPGTTSTVKIPLGKAEKLMGASAPEVERAWKEAAYDIRNYYGSPDFSVRGALLNAAATYFPFAPAVQRAVISDFQKMFPIGDAVSAVRGRPFDKKRLAEAGAAWGRMFQVFGIPALGVAAVNALPENKQDYERLPDWAREGNINIPLYETTFPDGSVRTLPYMPAPMRNTLGVSQKPAYFESERAGEAIREYVRIPMQGNFNRAFNALANSVASDSANSPDYLDVVDTFLTNSAPINVSGDTLGERAMSVISSTNPVIRAPFEQAANMNFFTKQPIVDRNKMNASDPLLQFDPERNVALVKGLAEAVPEWVKEAAPALASPQRLEGGIRAMTGNLLDLAKPSTLSPDNPARDANPLLGRFYRSESVDTDATREMAQQAEGQTVDQNIIDDNTARDFVKVIEDPALTREQKAEYARGLAAEGKLTEGVIAAMDKRLEAKALGLGSDDRIVRGLGSTEARARFYKQKIATFGGDRQAIAAYLKDQYEKNLFTDAVAEELGRLSQ